MRWIGILCLLMAAPAVLKPAPAQDSGPVVQIRHLSIVSTDLPLTETQAIRQAMEGHSYPLLEIALRVQQLLGDQGYAKGHAEIVDLPTLLQSPPQTPATLSVRVIAGVKYRIEAIVIEGAASFPRDEVLRLFTVRVGDLYNSSALGADLNRLNVFYSSRSYEHFAAVPALQFNEVDHTVVIRVVVREG